MDAFYASIEQRDNPRLRGKPVVVGGLPGSRGVVATASYEARKFGVHSAMPSSKAKRLCPAAIFVKPRMQVYSAVSREIREIFRKYTNLVEPLSLDEAYLDVTENKEGIPSALWIADRIRKELKKRTGITGSAGVSYNKFLAKMASDLNKPDGSTVITPGNALDFIAALPIGKFYGIGRSTETRMQSLGIRTGADLQTKSESELIRRFGKAGAYYYHVAHGRDDRPVTPFRIRKSVGAERTFQEDILRIENLYEILETIAKSVETRLAKANAAGKTVTLKVRYNDFKTITRSTTVRDFTNNAGDILEITRPLLDSTDAGNIPLRLLGITLSNLDLSLDHSPYEQLELPLD